MRCEKNVAYVKEQCRSGKSQICQAFRDKAFFSCRDADEAELGEGGNEPHRLFESKDSDTVMMLAAAGFRLVFLHAFGPNVTTFFKRSGLPTHDVVLAESVKLLKQGRLSDLNVNGMLFLTMLELKCIHNATTGLVQSVAALGQHSASLRDAVNDLAGEKEMTLEKLEERVGDHFTAFHAAAADMHQPLHEMRSTTKTESGIEEVTNLGEADQWGTSKKDTDKGSAATRRRRYNMFKSGGRSHTEAAIATASAMLKRLKLDTIFKKYTPSFPPCTMFSTARMMTQPHKKSCAISCAKFLFMLMPLPQAAVQHCPESSLSLCTGLAALPRVSSSRPLQRLAKSLNLSQNFS